MPYDSSGNWIAAAIRPKTEGKGKGKVNAASEKIVKVGAKPNLEEAAAVVKPKGGSKPRKSGDRVERLVAKSLGGERTIGSGAFKNSNRNLTGDVEVPDNEGKDFIKVEVKASGAISAKGEKNYTIKKDELDQMVREAEHAGEKGALIFHFKGQNIEDAYVIMQMKHWKDLVDEAKAGRTSRK